MACVAAHGYTCDEFLVDVPDNVAPINPVIGEDTVEHILLTIKERPQRAAAIVRRIPDGEEREENHPLDNMDILHARIPEEEKKKKLKELGLNYD